MGTKKERMEKLEAATKDMDRMIGEAYRFIGTSKVHFDEGFVEAAQQCYQMAEETVTRLRRAYEAARTEFDNDLSGIKLFAGPMLTTYENVLAGLDDALTAHLDSLS